jgi:hypothetical protein
VRPSSYGPPAATGNIAIARACKSSTPKLRVALRGLGLHTNNNTMIGNLVNSAVAWLIAGSFALANSRPDSIRFALPDGVSNDELQWFSLTPIAADTMKTRSIREALAGCQQFFGVLVER